MPNPKKDSIIAAENRRRELQANGWTVFKFDLSPRYTKGDLSLGNAIRYLMRMSGYKISFWRCPIRGLAVRYQSAPKTSYLYDGGDGYMLLHFSDNESDAEAKRELVANALLVGIDLFRGLPNKLFQEQTAIIRTLISAPVDTPTEEWLALKNKLFPYFQHVVETRQTNLRQHLL